MTPARLEAARLGFAALAAASAGWVSYDSGAGVWALAWAGGAGLWFWFTTAEWF